MLHAPVNATQIRKFEPILKIKEETKPDILPDIWYHCECWSIFTMKEDLQHIEKEKQGTDSEGTSSELSPRRSIRYPTSELLLPKKCRSKVKLIRKTRTQGKLIFCNNSCIDQTLKMASQPKIDKRIMTAHSDELIAKDAYYHRTCCQSLSRDFLSNWYTEEQSVDESSAFKKVTIYLSNLIENPDIHI